MSDVWQASIEWRQVAGDDVHAMLLHLTSLVVAKLLWNDDRDAEVTVMPI